MKCIGLFICTTVMIGLIGCSDKNNEQLKNIMGINYKAPDEFSVIYYPPLVVPPILKTDQYSSITTNTRAQQSIKRKMIDKEVNKNFYTKNIKQLLEGD